MDNIKSFLVNISKYNESLLLVKGIKKHQLIISDHFKFRVPGFMFQPKRKRGWDGYIRLYNRTKCTLPYGLLPRLLKLLKSNNIIYHIEENVPPTLARLKKDKEDYFSLEDAKSLFESLNLPSRYIARDDQLLAVVHVIRQERCLLLSPTSSGKSLIAYLVIRHMLGLLPKNLNRSKVIALVVPNSNLVDQMYNNFIEYSSGTDKKQFDVLRDCHKIYSGETKATNKPVVISTWQSLSNIEDKEWFKTFRIFIGDEAHTFKADSLTELMFDKFVKARMRIGMTGSLDEEKIHHLIIEGIFGPKKTAITTQEMIDKKISSSLNIECICLNYSPKDKDTVHEKDYNFEMEFLAKHQKRTQYICDLAKSLKGNTIILFRKIKYGEEFYKILNGKKTFLVHGGTSLEDRQAIIDFAEANDKVIIIASIGVFSTGVSINNLQNAIFGIPFKSRITGIQTVGRVLRKDGKNNAANLYDICDDLRYGLHVNYAYRHWRKRLKVYKSEGHVYNKTVVNL